jgi:hypothetical protein
MTETEAILRQRVQTLRPALALAVKYLHHFHNEHRDSHEGGEIWRVIQIGERALADTADPTTD